jgi:hypothetical protein
MAISLHFATLLEAITFFTSSAVQAYIAKKNTFMESNSESLYLLFIQQPSQNTKYAKFNIPIFENSV